MTHRTDGELQAYLDAELAREEAAEVAEHLLVCVECRGRLGELRTAHENLRQALQDLDEGAMPRLRRRTRVARRALLRAAVLLLAVVGAAAAIVPGSPIRSWFERERPATTAPLAPVPIPGTTRAETERAPGVASVTVAPVDGRVSMSVTGFAPGSVVRVALTRRADVLARLASGRVVARFAVGPGQLEVVGSPDQGPAEVVIELPRGLSGATLKVNGRESLLLSPDGLMRPGDPTGTGREGVVLPVEG